MEPKKMLRFLICLSRTIVNPRNQERIQSLIEVEVMALNVQVAIDQALKQNPLWEPENYSVI